MLPVDDPTSLSRLFHLNSEPWLNEAAYRGELYLQEFKDHLEAFRVALPPTPLEGVAALAAKRISVRRFEPEPMPLETLAALLRAAYGIVEIAALPNGGAFLRRSVPSAGGLYPIELYVLARRVEGVPLAVCHFDARGEALEVVRPGDWTKAAAAAFYTWPFIDAAPAVVCFAAVFSRCQKKYGPRGYRYIMLEAGHAAQTLCLAAEERGLATLCMGGYRDHLLNRLAGLEPFDEGVIYAIAVGRRAE